MVALPVLVSRYAFQLSVELKSDLKDFVRTLTEVLEEVDLTGPVTVGAFDVTYHGEPGALFTGFTIFAPVIAASASTSV